MNEQTDGLTLEEASEVIKETLMAEEPMPEEEPSQPEPEIDQQESAQEAQQVQQVQLTQQATLVRCEQAITDEAQSIKAAENAAHELRDSNPAEYGARMADLNVRSKGLTDAYGKYQAMVTQFDSSVTASHQQHLVGEQKKLARAIPGWDKEKQEKLVGYLKGEGYSDAQLANVTDAKTIKLAWDAMSSKKAPKKTLLKKKPKGDRRAQAESEITRRHLGHNSLQAAQERILAMMK